MLLNQTSIQNPSANSQVKSRNIAFEAARNLQPGFCVSGSTVTPFVKEALLASSNHNYGANSMMVALWHMEILATEILDQYYVSGKLPTYPSPNLTFAQSEK